MPDFPTTDEMERRVANDPGGEYFPELAARLLDDSASRPRAREICFQGLRRNPSNTRGRLVLARAFFLDGMYEFSVRELLELKNIAEIPAVEKLITAFGVYAQRYNAPQRKTAPRTSAPQGAAATPGNSESDGGVVAEVDLDADFLEAMDQAK